MELFRPDTGLAFWMILVFGIVFFVLWKYAWPFIIKAIGERERYISESITAADEAQVRLQEIERERIELLAKAREEQIQILQEGKIIRDKTVNEAKQIAREEAEKIVEEARRTIVKEREELKEEVRREVIEMSVEIAGKVLRRELSDKAVRDGLLISLIDEIEPK
jgi:ATP synthase, F0 subunit b